MTIGNKPDANLKRIFANVKSQILKMTDLEEMGLLRLRR